MNALLFNTRSGKSPPVRGGGMKATPLLALTFGNVMHDRFRAD
jgi:hypothetical protein